MVVSGTTTQLGAARADLLLASLPVVFGLVYAAAILVAGRHALAVGSAAVACIPLVSDGLFLNPPTGE